MISTAVSENSYYNDRKLYEGEYCCNLFKLEACKNILKTSGINFCFEIHLVHKMGLGRIYRQDSLVLKTRMKMRVFKYVPFMHGPHILISHLAFGE